MKAVVKETKSQGFVLKEIKEPQIANADEVKIKMIYSSICGSDVHIYNWDEWSQKEISIPHINGHEGVGQVVEIGEKVTNVKVGDYVGYETHYYCMKCFQCKTDNKHVCKNMKILGVHIEGVWREKAVLPSRLLFKIPSDTKVPLRYLGILEPFGNAYHTLSYTELKGKNILIQGDGPIGIFAALIAKAKGAKNIILSGWGSTVRKDIAIECGIEFVDRSKYNSYEDFNKKISDLTNEVGIHFIGEFTGNPSGLQDAIKMIEPAGHIGILSIYNKNTFDLDVNTLVLKNATMQFICGRRIFDTWTESFKLINSGQVSMEHIDKIITHQYDLADFQKGFDQIFAGKACKVLLDIDSSLDKKQKGGE